MKEINIIVYSFIIAGIVFLLSSKAFAYQELFEQIYNKYPPRNKNFLTLSYLRFLIAKESGWRNVRGKTGDLGLFQFTIIAWEDVINHYPELSVYSDFEKYALEPEINLRFGILYSDIIVNYLKNLSYPVNNINFKITWNRGIGYFRDWYRRGAKLQELPYATRRLF